MTSQAFPPAFTGVVAAPLTPFNDDGEIDPDAVPRLVDFLLEGGVSGLMVGGTTGEFIAQTPNERGAMIEAFVKAVDGAVPVIAHIGHVHQHTAEELARRAVAAGADALTALTPYYHRASPAAVEAAMRELARSAGDVPFLVYNFPDATGNPLSFSTFQSLLNEPNLAGVKLSVGSIAEVEPYVDVLDRVCVMSGNDMLMPAAVGLGVKSAVSGNAAAFPDLVSALLRGLIDGDPIVVDRAPGLLGALSASSRGGSPDRLRELLRRRGVDVGVSRIRTYVPSDIDPVEDERLLKLLSEAAVSLR